MPKILLKRLLRRDKECLVSTLPQNAAAYNSTIKFDSSSLFNWTPQYKGSFLC
jgi:hypothetical protein